MPARKFASTMYQAHNHQVMSQTRSPLSYQYKAEALKCLAQMQTDRHIDTQTDTQMDTGTDKPVPIHPIKPSYCKGIIINLLSDMPILGSSNSAANKDMMSKTWTNGDRVI